MKATTAIGIVVAFVGLALGATMEGSQIPAFFNVPALVIIMSGTIGSVMASNSFENMKAIPALYKTAIGGATPDLNERAQLLVGLAERARREGLLALDDEIAKIDDPFVKKGLQLVVDGTDADVVAEVLEIETEAMGGRRRVHRHALRRRDGERDLPAEGEPPRRPVQGRGRAADADARGHPRHPGGRQPADPRREAPELHPARAAQRRPGGRGCGRSGERRRRR